MGLFWSWSNKCGEAVIEQNRDGEKFTYTEMLYQGNALLIFLWEDKKQYCVKSFWCDESHAKRCLGIPQKGDKEAVYNIYNDIDKLKSVKLYRDKISKGDLKKLVGLFAQADFEDITIEIVNSPKQAEVTA